MGDLITQDDGRLSAAQIRANINIIQEVMKACMLKDVHYGTIPGTQKPTLYKAGSEKILSTFRIAVEIDVEDMSTHDSFRYRVKARGVIPSGEIVGCGIGECSTDEEKYRWRGAVCPEEFEATPEDRKRLKWVKGWQDKPAKSIPQIRTNPADLANTVLKMAKKRAQIDLTLTATAASDVFEQDIEDLPEEYREGMRENGPPKGKPEVKQPQRKAPPPNEAQEKYFPRIEAALDLLFGDAPTARASQIIELTTWTKNKGKENEEIVNGTPDYRAIKTEKTLEILTHKLEALAKKAVKDDAIPEKCAECGEINGHTISCPLAEPPDA